MDFAQLRRELNLTKYDGLFLDDPDTKGWASVEKVNKLDGTTTAVGHWSVKGLFRYPDGTIVGQKAPAPVRRPRPATAPPPPIRYGGDDTRTKGSGGRYVPRHDIAPILRTIPKIGVGYIAWRKLRHYVLEPLVALSIWTWASIAAHQAWWYPRLAVLWGVWALWTIGFLLVARALVRKADDVIDEVEDGLYDFAHPEASQMGDGPRTEAGTPFYAADPAVDPDPFEMPRYLRVANEQVAQRNTRLAAIGGGGHRRS